MNLFDWLLSWFDSSIDYRLERYLGQSVDRCDLEHRLKNWDYMSETERNSWWP
jgi:hypothetical protein